MRVSEEFLRMVDDWRRRQKDLPSRAEAIRRLVELATRLRTTSERDRWGTSLAGTSRLARSTSRGCSRAFRSYHRIHRRERPRPRCAPPQCV